MAKLKFDDGLKTYQVGGGVLRFNPRDPDLYQRFLDGVTAMQELAAQELQSPQEADAALRSQLQRIFPDADWGVLLPQNLMALCDNGKMLVLNFLEAIEEVLVEGARSFARGQ